MTRYARQMILPEVGPQGQIALEEAHVLIIGAGGLGVPALQYLTAAGIGQITLVDPDRIEESNLHRQPLYRMDDIGRFKAEAARDAMRALNPAVDLRVVTEWLTPVNATSMVAKADIVLDCADSYAVSYTLSDICLEIGTPLISASALGLQGYVGGFCGGAPSLRALFPDPTGNTGTCATAGILGPVVGMLGCLQAQMAMRVMLHVKPSPLGLLIRMDEAMRFSQFRFDGAPENPGPHFTAIGELRADDLIIDLRDEVEAPQTATDTALRMPEYGATGPLPAGNQRVVITCRSGLRAWRAANRLAERWDGEIALLALQGDRE